ncbi:MAG: hypothetical protein LBR10_15010 [Prevotellaceae bacterium]|jgi:hypothetical protein|nr:hypothetical protein [Prevotellaceae bacterium]
MATKDSLMATETDSIKVLGYRDLPNIDGWKPSREYDNTAIDGIPDSDGVKKQITSIPSPFARIDLVQTAFKKVARDLDGTNIYHKMVSDSFDVGEIFFNHDRLSDLIEVIVWDKVNDLDALLFSTNMHHRQLGETLKLFLEQDAETYNFNLMQRLYLLNYKDGPNPINIIGGTSPCSLFFASANNLSYVKNIRFGSNVVFNNGLQPLHKRDFEYVKYIFYLTKNITNFSQKFKYVNEYLELTFKKLDQINARVINNLEPDKYFTEFDELYIDNPGNSMEINGDQLRKKKPNLKLIEDNSEFIIQPTKTSENVKPIILPSVKANFDLTYTTDKWDRNYEPVFEESENLANRRLPHTREPYPFLTISDFLEPTIIRTVFPINKEKFYDGDLQNNDTKGYLLPLKKTFFDYFNISELKEKIFVDGKKMFQISEGANGGVKVELRIPIKGNRLHRYITYERIYYPLSEPKLSENKGALLENQFNLLLYPFIKLTDANNHYRIGLIDRDISPRTINNEYEVRFFEQTSNTEIASKAQKSRSIKENGRDEISSKYYILEKTFDYMEITNGISTGIIIPNFMERVQGNKKISFAIDFGTTNTHVEYAIEGGYPRPLDITVSDMQIATLHDRSFYERDPSLNGTAAGVLVDVIRHEFMPEFIGKDTEFKFPTRTAISANSNLNSEVPTYALADFNISFAYEKYRKPNNTQINTNLKWANYSNDNNGNENVEMKRIDTFFENLMLIIRNKILLAEGKLADSDFVWFYPTSMETFRRNLLEKKWKDIYNKYISTEKQPLKLSESIAPFYYFNKELGVTAAGRPVVAMDIGGGTTDIVIYCNDTPEILTSVRFAANSVFGDAFNGSPQINGFIKIFQGRIASALEQNKLYDILDVFRQLIDTGTSSDIIAFFFSIENNKKVRDAEIPVSFNQMLTMDNDLKIIFVLFYSSLIYHIAKIMKVKGLDAPRFMTFSGTGSKIINIVDSSVNLNILSKLTAIIFRKVMGQNPGNIELQQYPEPKEITCKGGLKIPQMQTIQKTVSIDLQTSEGKSAYAEYLDSIKATLLGDVEDTLIAEKVLKYEIFQDVQKARELKESIIEEYDKFIELFFSINDEFGFTNNFGISPPSLTKAKELLQSKDDCRMYLNSGIQEKLNYLKNNLSVEIEESFFFYPLIGGINKLAFEIFKSIKSR